MRFGDDGRQYELFVKSTHFARPRPAEAYYPPVIRFHDGNDYVVVQTLTWAQAQRFLALPQDEGQRFQELFAVVQNQGRQKDQ